MDTGYERREPFQSVNTRAQWVYWIFIIMMVVYIVAVWADFAQAELLSRAIAGETITWPEATTNDNRQAVIGLAEFVLFVASAVVFLMWVHRTHRNLPSLGATGLRFTPRWAVGWFFVPIMSLFRPYQAVAEISKASDPNVDTTDGTSWESASPSPLVRWWWAFFLISNLVAWVVVRAALSTSYSTELSDLLFVTHAYIVSDAIDVVGILITILMVKRITQLQETKSKLISYSSLGRPAI